MSLPFTVIPSRHCGRCSRSLLGLVAEAGPEAIIPLSVGMRSRALALYEETGRRLGVRPYAKDWTSGKWDEIKTVWDTAKVSFAADREAGQRAAAIQYAIGGILTRPHLGMVAEAGPEAIIPLSPRFRNRAWSLYQRVGNWLGTPSFSSVPLLAGAGGYGGNISISTGPITAQFNITTSSNPDDVINAIREKYEDLVDELSEAIADGLDTIYSNMPRRMPG